MRNVSGSATAIALTAVLVVATSGCGQSPPPPGAVGTSPGTAAPPAPLSGAAPAPGLQEDHAHKPGMNGGIIVPIGRDSYHAEAVFDSQGDLSIYMLGQDESRVQEVEQQKLTAYVKAVGGPDAQSFSVEPAPQDGDSGGKTSRFKGTLPVALRGQAVEVTIPNIRINGERFRVGFPSVLPGSHEGEGMPAVMADDEARALYLTPGGIYTEADIAANGNQTGNQKFRGFVPKHDLKPKVGDKICPITLTKANPQCSWIVGGKTYEFCCPPCVEEFVKLAKEQPEEVKEPADYVKR